MKRKFISQPILASWKDAYRQMEEVFDPLWNDEVIYYEMHKAPYAQGPAMQAVYDLYREHKGDPDWDEAYARFTASGDSEYNEAIMSSSVFGQDAGMILEVFQDAVDEIEIPEGYNWDYKIDQLENNELAGQIFIMTDDDQPVAFFTFALTKDGEPLDIVNDRKLYTKLVNELKSEVRKLGDMSEFVGKPKQETIVLASITRTISASTLTSLYKLDQNQLEDYISDCLRIIKQYAEYAESNMYYSVTATAEDIEDLVGQVHKLEDVLHVWYDKFGGYEDAR
jgi:hypothetical protein